MRAVSPGALDEALREAAPSLDAIPAVLAEAARSKATANQQRLQLAKLRGRVAGGLQNQDPVGQMKTAQDALRRATRSASRRLKLRILWLQLRLFWRAVRVYVFGLLLLGLIIAGVVWAVQNKAMIVEYLRVLIPPAPPASPAGPAGTQPGATAVPASPPGIATQPAATGQSGAGTAPAAQGTAPLQSPPVAQVQE